MAQLGFHRRTHLGQWCEFVLEDDDPRAAKDPTPRTTTVQRIFSRGDLSVWRGVPRDVLITTGRDAARTVTLAARMTRDHLDVDLRALGWTLTWPRERGQPMAFDIRIGPALGATVPTPETRVTDYLTRPKERARA